MTDEHIRLDRIVGHALEEDLGSGDLTTDLTVDSEARGRASLLAREEMVLAGIHVFARVFRFLSPEFDFEFFFTDGERVPAGERICRVSGPLAPMLKAERTAL
ncbi:MAG: nicotinate-nucleotide diphosphorylase (carboxylating), partial [Deltaproteobacteria bacterium]|nr:nicotinate-nucleotide diphosphorylase (carboxylating) [Deltaproteobacteria bacterium]